MGAAMQHIGPGAPVLDDPVGACSQCTVDHTIFRRNARQIHLRNDLDDARAADAGDTDILGRILETRLIGPLVDADHLEAGFERGRIDPHPLDGTRCGSLARRDFSALKGRTRWRRSRDGLGRVAQDDFRIRADIDHQHDVIATMRAFRQCGSSGVRADMAGNTGQHIHARARRQGEAIVRGAHLHRVRHSERKRRAAQFGRVDAQKQMMHDRIADEHRVENVDHLDVRLFGDIGDQSVERIAHGDRHRLAALGVHHHIGDAAHQVFAEADLRVRSPGRGNRHARQERHQMQCDGG